jgi:uncharacterized membrane protein
VTDPVPTSISLIRSNDAGRGIRWWADSVTWLFGDIARLGVWVAMLICFFLLLTPLNWFPFIGSVASYLLWFVFSGGLMLAARKTGRGQTPSFGDLFAGFGPQGGALVGAGLLILAASLAVVGLMLAVGLGAFVGSILSAASLADLEAQPLAVLSIGWGSLLLLLCCLFLFVPISMAAWLAPALIMLRGASPVDALRMSLAACRRNLGALTVYGLVFIGLAFVATLMFLIGWIFLVPLTFLSTYAAFRDMFDTEVEVLDAVASQPS